MVISDTDSRFVFDLLRRQFIQRRKAFGREAKFLPSGMEGPPATIKPRHDDN
jgi:hypothetical protein